MAEPRNLHVRLTVDTSAFVAALENAAAAVQRWNRTYLSSPALRAFVEAWSAAERHHRRETPAASAMHAAYDHRRRARRRRR